MIGFGKRSGPTLPEQIEALREAVQLAEGRLHPDTIGFGQHVIEKAGERLRHGTTHTLVALLGPTGAGKSSMANALIGTDVATVGVRRPTTSTTLAAVWGGDEEVVSSGPLLDWLGVAERYQLGSNDRLNGLIVLDVPDHDSVELEHQEEMERIAENADLLVWVTDPEKYADASLHHYLRYLTAHEAVTVVLLNKSDTLDAEELITCRTDLSRLLVDDGVASATVLTVAATTGAGVDELRSLLTRAVTDQESIVDRLRADVAVVAGEMSTEVGGDPANKLTERAIDRLTDDLVDASGIDPVIAAVAESTRRDASDSMGWPFTRWVNKLRPDPLRRLHLGHEQSGRTSLPSPTGSQLLRAETSIRDFADELSSGLTSPWPRLIREAGTPAPNILRDRLDTAVADAGRDHERKRPRWWSAIGAVQWLLAIAALTGGLWLAALFLLAWLQIPDPPTPDLWGIPLPTVLFLGGAASGLLLSLIGRRTASISVRRAAGRARRSAAANIRSTAEELVVAPVRIELESRGELARQLEVAGSKR